MLRVMMTSRRLLLSAVMLLIAASGCSKDETPTAPTAACTVTAGAISASTFGAAGRYRNPVPITAGSGCAWTATSSATFVTISAGASGSGNGTASFTVAANAGAARDGDAGGRRHVVHDLPERRRHRNARQPVGSGRDLADRWPRGHSGASAAHREQRDRNRDRWRRDLPIRDLRPAHVPERCGENVLCRRRGTGLGGARLATANRDLGNRRAVVLARARDRRDGDERLLRDRNIPNADHLHVLGVADDRFGQRERRYPTRLP